MTWKPDCSSFHAGRLMGEHGDDPAIMRVRLGLAKLDYSCKFTASYDSLYPGTCSNCGAWVEYHR